MPNQTRRALVAAFVVLALGFSVTPVVNYFRGETKKDYPLWYGVGQQILRGQDLYPRDRTDFPFMYPPPAALLLVPLSALGQLPMMVALLMLNSAAWAAAVLLSVLLAAGNAWDRHPLLYLLPSACCVFSVHDMYLLGQPNLLLLALLLGAFACLRTGRDLAAGLLVALAVAIKAFPILVVPYLVYRRHWRALAWAVGFLAALLVLVPAPVRGFQRNLDELGVWARGMVFRYDADGIGQRPAQGYGYRNQSLVAVAHRLLRPVNAEMEFDEKEPVFVNVADLDFRTVSVVVVAAALGLGLFFVWSMPPRGRRTAESDAVEFAMLIVLVLMCSPYTFGYYYVWLLYPFTIVVNLALTAASPRERNRTVAWFVACLLLLGLSLPFPWPRVPQALGSSFWACLVLLVCLGLRLRWAGGDDDKIVIGLSR